MNALLIDSNLQALAELERLLRQDGRLADIHSCSDPASAFSQLRRFRPDVVFLDTVFVRENGRSSGAALPESPDSIIPANQADGIALARRIRKAYPRIHLVFLSADKGLAYEASQVFPRAFLLKPARPSRLRAALDHLLLAAAPDLLFPEQAVYPLRCLGEYEIVHPHAPTARLQFPTQLSRELLAFLIAHFERTVARSDLMAALIPDRQDDLAINLLHVNLYKLRRFLEQNARLLAGAAIRERYRLTIPEGVCDFIDFTRYIRAPEVLSAGNISRAEMMASLYRGPCFAFEDYTWCDSLKAELEVAHEQLLLRIAGFRWSHGEPGLSEHALKTLIQINPLSEEGHCTLLDQYLKRDERRKFLHGFEHYQKIMREELDVPADKGFQRLYQQMQASSG